MVVVFREIVLPEPAFLEIFAVQVMGLASKVPTVLRDPPRLKSAIQVVPLA